MTNQQFCYWLQGYFEIADESVLTENKLQLIDKALKNISEPLGVFTHWLFKVIRFLETQEFKKNMIALFLPEIQNRLNSIFFHVIDNSYERMVDVETARKIHTGSKND